jgi:hypothetical protein
LTYYKPCDTGAQTSALNLAPTLQIQKPRVIQIRSPFHSSRTPLPASGTTDLFSTPRSHSDDLGGPGPLQPSEMLGFRSQPCLAMWTGAIGSSSSLVARPDDPFPHPALIPNSPPPHFSLPNLLNLNSEPSPRPTTFCDVLTSTPIKDPLFYQPPLPIRPQPSPFSHPQSLFRVHNMPMIPLFVPLPLAPRQISRCPAGHAGLFVSFGVLLRMGVRAESPKSPGAEGRGRGDPVGRVSSSAEVLQVQLE